MTARDKKYDDGEEEITPATWVAKHAQGYRRQLQPPNTRSVRSEKRYTYKAKDAREDDETTAFLSCCDLEDERSCPAMTARLPKSKPFRRIFMLLCGMLALGYFSWTQAVGPLTGADWHIREGFLHSFRGTYGFAKGGDYDMAENRIVRLDEWFMPGGVRDPDAKGRLVFVGDIHGCKHELIALLKECSFDADTDHLIATGDVISKGPDSPGVIDELIRLNATTVRGNHEDRILTLASVAADTSKNQAQDVTSSSAKDKSLLKSLHKRHIAFLRQTPLILRIPTLPLVSTLSRALKHDTLSSEILVVHGGLVPAVPLRKQDPYYVMNMRSLGRRTHTPSSHPASKSAQTLPWFELWNWYQDRLDKKEVIQGWHEIDTLVDPDHEPRRSWISKALSVLNIGRKRPQPQIVVYGHDSREGLKDKRWTKGLDSGCVKGGKLTALVLDAYGRTELVSVKCKHYLS